MPTRSCASTPAWARKSPSTIVAFSSFVRSSSTRTTLTPRVSWNGFSESKHRIARVRDGESTLDGTRAYWQTRAACEAFMISEQQKISFRDHGYFVLEKVIP